MKWETSNDQRPTLESWRTVVAGVPPASVILQPTRLPLQKTGFSQAKHSAPRLTRNHAATALRRFGQFLTFFFAIVNYEGVVFSVGRPRPAWHFTKGDKPPVGHVRLFQCEIVADGWRDIEARAFIEIESRTFIAENVLPVIGTERSCVLPLRVSRAIAFADGDPSVFARRDGRALIRFFKPRYNAWRFEPMTCACLIVVRKRTIKWVLSRREFYRDVVASVGRIRVVKTAVISCPSFVPGTCAIWDGIISTRPFADPKDSCYDTSFPRIPPCRPRRLR